MSNDEEWLAQLRAIYEADRVKRESLAAQAVEPAAELSAADLLQQCNAHGLVRQVQRALLNGGGKIQFYEDVGGYEQAIVLIWSGPISDAAAPAEIKDVDASLIVGANDDGVFVNDRKLSNPSPQALQTALLEMAREIAGRDGR